MADGTHSLLVHDLRGATYGLDYDGLLDLANPVLKVSKLTDLCASVLISSRKSLQHALRNAPYDVYPNLLRAVLESENDDLLKEVVACWPLNRIGLKRLALLSTPCEIDCYASEVACFERLRHLLRCTTCLVSAFVLQFRNRTQALSDSAAKADVSSSAELETATKLESNGRVEVLDLSGYPLAEVSVLFLASHCILAANERRQLELLNDLQTTLRQAAERGSEKAQRMLDSRVYETAESQNVSLLTTVPEFRVLIDAYVCAPDVFDELVRALELSSPASGSSNRLRLLLNSVECEELDAARVRRLLDAVDHTRLCGLALPFSNTLVSADCLERLSCFSKLTRLNLSCNSLNVRRGGIEQQPEVDITLARIRSSLDVLPCLSRLDLSNNTLRGRLRDTLSERTVCRLSFLKLSACYLNSVDFEWLIDLFALSRSNEECSSNAYSLQDASGVSRTACALKLRELDISENSLQSCSRELIMRFFETLLCDESSPLLVLNLSGANLADSTLLGLCELLQNDLRCGLNAHARTFGNARSSANQSVASSSSSSTSSPSPSLPSYSPPPPGALNSKAETCSGRRLTARRCRSRLACLDLRDNVFTSQVLLLFLKLTVCFRPHFNNLSLLRLSVPQDVQALALENTNSNLYARKKKLFKDMLDCLLGLELSSDEYGNKIAHLRVVVDGLK